MTLNLPATPVTIYSQKDFPANSGRTKWDKNAVLTAQIPFGKIAAGWPVWWSNGGLYFVGFDGGSWRQFYCAGSNPAVAVADDLFSADGLAFRPAFTLPPSLLVVRFKKDAGYSVPFYFPTQKDLNLTASNGQAITA